jgi:hypothetical protein
MVLLPDFHSGSHVRALYGRYFWSLQKSLNRRVKSRLGPSLVTHYEGRADYMGITAELWRQLEVADDAASEPIGLLVSGVPDDDILIYKRKFLNVFIVPVR